MIWVIAVIIFSVSDALLTGHLLGLGLEEGNFIYPSWLLTGAPLRGAIATAGAFWLYSRNWDWLLWGWTLLLFGVVTWNLFALLVVKFVGWSQYGT